MNICGASTESRHKACRLQVSVESYLDTDVSDKRAASILQVKSYIQVHQEQEVGRSHAGCIAELFP
jgi:hypothetical protein